MKFFIYIVFLAFLVIIAALYRNREGFDTNTTTPSKVDLSSVLNLVSSVVPSQTSQTQPPTIQINPSTLSGTSLNSLLNIPSQSSNVPSVVDPLASTNWNPTIPRVNSSPPPQPTQPLYTLPNIPYISNITCPTCQPSSTPTPTTPMPTSGCPYSTPPNFTSALPKGVTLDQIPDCFKDKYILKTEIVPPVCPACPACNAYPAPTTPLATTPQATCTCSHSTPTPSVTTSPNPSFTTPNMTTSPNPSITTIALNATPNPSLQGMNSSQGENPSHPSQKDPYYQSKMNSNYGTSFDNYPFQTPMRQTNYTQYINSQGQSQDMPPLNPFVYNTSSQNDSPWPMPILNDFSKFGS
jgi:hypothetical protein